MLDKLGIAALFTDMEGKVDECNKTACALMAREKEEVIGLALADDLVSEGGREGAKAAVEGAITGVEKNGNMLNLIKKEGDEITVIADVGPRQVGEEITGSMTIARPPTASLDMLDDLGICAWFTDLEGTIDYCNKAYNKKYIISN